MTDQLGFRQSVFGRRRCCHALATMPIIAKDMGRSTNKAMITPAMILNTSISILQTAVSGVFHTDSSARELSWVI